MIYSWIGKTTIKFAARYVRQRYRNQARIALGLGVGVAALAAYLATREVPEG
jgi:hypothetical protein